MNTIVLAGLALMTLGSVYCFSGKTEQAQSVTTGYATPKNIEKNIERGSYITHLSWGKVTVEYPDKTTVNYKDALVYPEGSQKWDWKKTGTEHVPGIQIADVKELADKVEIVILSRGMDLVLQVKSETLEYLRSRNKEYHVLQSEQAVKLYNSLISQGKRVGIVLHSTC